MRAFAGDLTGRRVMRSNVTGMSRTHFTRRRTVSHFLSHTWHTHTSFFLRLKLGGNRAERKLRAFTKQGLSGVMATGADYPALLHQPREGGGGCKERQGGGEDGLMLGGRRCEEELNI